MIKGTPNAGINGTLTNGLLAHYSFNDGSLADLSGNGNDAMAVGTPELGVDKDGQEGQAVKLTDKTYIYSGNFLQGSPEISGSLMFKTSNDSVPLIHFASDLSLSSTSDFIIFAINTKLYVDRMIDTGINLADYTYHHLVFLSNETGLDLYLDKKYIGKVAQGINNYTYICFGTPSYYGGERIIIDEIRLYNRRLTGETSVVNQEPTGEIAEIFDMGANYVKGKDKISEIEFNIDFDKTQLGTFIEIKYLDIKANGASILDKNPIVKYWTNDDKTVRVFDKEVETFGDSTDLYFQIECDGYEPSDVIHKELKKITVSGYNGGYNGGLTGYAKYDNDNYKKSEARILIPLTNTSFISYKK